MSFARSDGVARRARLLAALRHPVSQNAAALYAVQIVLTIVPLATIPYLARVLGPSELGKVVYAQSFSFLAGMLIEYGFGMSATRQIAQHRDDRSAVADIAASVFGAKIMLIGGTTALTLAAAFAVPEFRADPVYALFAWLMAVAQGFAPIWFFQGLERLRPTAILEVTVRVGAAVAIILLVQGHDQGIVVLYIWTGSSLAILAVLLTMMYRVVPARRPRLPASVTALKRGWILFLATVAASLYTTATVLLLGIVVTAAQLAMFAAVERITRASMRVIGPLAGATYPRVSYYVKTGNVSGAQRLATVTLLVQTGIGVLVAAVLIVFAPTVVSIILGPHYEPAVPILRTLALLVPFVSIGTAIGSQWLLPHGLDRRAGQLLAFPAVANLVLTPLIGSWLGTHGVAWVVVGLEAAISMAAGVLAWHAGLLPTREQLLKRGRYPVPGGDAPIAEEPELDTGAQPPAASTGAGAEPGPDSAAARSSSAGREGLSGVCAVILTCNRLDTLPQAIEAVLAQTVSCDEILVVDNASTDGTHEAMTRGFGDTVRLVTLTENGGSSGGFARGISAAYEREHRWLWLMDDDTIPSPTALEELLAGAERSPGPDDPPVLASRVLMTDGRLHPTSCPNPRMEAFGGVARDAANRVLRIRTATFVSLMLSRRAVQEHGLPREHYVVCCDDIEYTARILKHNPGYMIPQSVVVHRTRSGEGQFAGSGSGFYYHVRNSLLMYRGDAFTAAERVVRVRRWLGTIWTHLVQERFSPETLKIVGRGLFAGLRDPVR